MCCLGMKYPVLARVCIRCALSGGVTGTARGGRTCGRGGLGVEAGGVAEAGVAKSGVEHEVDAVGVVVGERGAVGAEEAGVVGVEGDRGVGGAMGLVGAE